MILVKNLRIILVRLKFKIDLTLSGCPNADISKEEEITFDFIVLILLEFSRKKYSSQVKSLLILFHGIKAKWSSVRI